MGDREQGQYARASCNLRFELCYCDISADALEVDGSATVEVAWGRISRSGT